MTFYATELERQVYKLMRDYKTNAEIAAELNMSMPSVSMWASRIYKKHNVAGRIEFLRLFREKLGGES